MPEIKKKLQNVGQNADTSPQIASNNDYLPPENHANTAKKAPANAIDHLAPYRFWGVNLDVRGAQAIGDCPFCTREDKFSVQISTGLWRCFVCGEGSDKGGGNIYTFIRKLWESAPRVEDPLDRGLSKETLSAWDIRWNHIRGEWMLAGRGLKGTIDQLYSYREDRKAKKRILYATPSVQHQLMGMQFFDPKKPEVWIIEGPWNAMIAWETLRCIKKDKLAKSGYSVTGSEMASLLSRINIIGVPGCNVFKEEWATLLDGKIVTLVFDSDHPRLVNSKMFRAGYDGMRRIVGVLCKATATPKEVRYVEWGPEGYDPTKPSGYDIRDLYMPNSIGIARGGSIATLLNKIKPIPTEWVSQGVGATSKKGTVEIEPIPCTEWKDLVNAWRIAMDWHPGLEGMLACGLACCVSTSFKGDQLWMKMVGPPSCGKTTIAEAWSVSKKYVKAVSTLTGMHSGVKSFEGGATDNSLLVLCKNKMLVIKDGDTLMQALNKEQILAELRDIYDRVSRTHYRHGLANDYEGLSMTAAICGTESLRGLDASEVGERLLDWIVTEKMSEEDEQRIARRAAYQAIRDCGEKSTEGAYGAYPPDTLRAMMMTGGYIEYLQANAEDLIKNVEFSDEAISRCQDLAMFISYARARPSKKQEESIHKELCFRLTKQVCRLAKFLPIVFNKNSVDAQVLAIVEKSAKATSRGRTLQLMKHLYSFGNVGASTSRLALLTNHLEKSELPYLEFLRHLGAVELFNSTNIKNNVKWRLSSRIFELYKTVIG